MGKDTISMWTSIIRVRIPSLVWANLFWDSRGLCRAVILPPGVNYGLSETWVS